MIFAATATGRDLAPRVAARLGVPLLTDCTDAEVSDGRVVVTRPVFAGKALGTRPGTCRPRAPLDPAERLPGPESAPSRQAVKDGT